MLSTLFRTLMVELCHSVGIRVCVEGVELRPSLPLCSISARIIFRGFCWDILSPQPVSRRCSCKSCKNSRCTTVFDASPGAWTPSGVPFWLMWPHGLLCCAKPPEKAAFPREGKAAFDLPYGAALFFRYPRGIFLNFFKALRTDDMLHTAGVLGRCLGRDTQTNQAVRQQAVTLIHALRRRAARLCQTG